MKKTFALLFFLPLIGIAGPSSGPYPPGGYGTLTLNNQYTYAPVTITTTNTLYAGVYSYAGTDAWAHQYATNANGAWLHWNDDASEFEFSPALNAASTIFYSEGEGIWRFLDDSPANITGLVGNVEHTFRTLVNPGKVQLPDEVWSGLETGGDITLNNGYLRYDFKDVGGQGTFAITGIANLNDGKPKSVSFKLYNDSQYAQNLALTISLGASPRRYGSLVTTVPYQKVCRIIIFDDGQGTDHSVEYSTVLEQ